MNQSPTLETEGLWVSQEEESALRSFKESNADLFAKDDTRLAAHLVILIGLLALSTSFVIMTPSVLFKVLLGVVNAFLWFSLINVTIHHHHTHRNAAKSPKMKKLMDILYNIAVPNGPKRRPRYVRVHLNHHARPFHESDVDHYYGTQRYLKMRKTPWTMFLYFLELTFIGGHVPGWDDDHYMSSVPMEHWNHESYAKMKKIEVQNARKFAILQWSLFLIVLGLLPVVAWAWVFPMLLVKHWAHFLGQFQHYDERLLDSEKYSMMQRTKTYHFPSFINYLCGGEISGHFLHHLYPELPYYNVEEARKRFVQDPALASFFAIY